jgi:PucR family transcriptional regulator, purine catabolism regulatory protein
VLASVPHDPAARRIVSDVLQPFLDYDARTSRDLLRALEVFLEDGCNTSSAARRLFLNRHSLLYRLGKIESGVAGRKTAVEPIHLRRVPP